MFPENANCQNHCSRGQTLRPTGRYHATPEGIKDHEYLQPRSPAIPECQFKWRLEIAGHRGSNEGQF